MNDSPLLQLPAEVRNVIYTFVHQQVEPISICCGLDKAQLLNESDEDIGARHLLALTTVSKQVRSESLQLFYACNAFRLVSKGLAVINQKDEVAAADYAHFEWIWQWLVTIGRQNCAALQRVTIVLGQYLSPKPTHSSDVFRKVFMILGGFSLFFGSTGTSCNVAMNVWVENPPKRLGSVDDSSIPLTRYGEAQRFVDNTIQAELASPAPRDPRRRHLIKRHKELQSIINNIFTFRGRQLDAVWKALDRFTEKRFGRRTRYEKAFWKSVDNPKGCRRRAFECIDRSLSVAMLPGVTDIARSNMSAYAVMLDTISHGHHHRQSYNPNGDQRMGQRLQNVVQST